MLEILGLPLKVVDGLTWPWRMAVRMLATSCMAMLSKSTAGVLWLILIPYRVVLAALREAETRRRLELLQVEFDRMAASVMELDGKLEAEKQERWRTTEKLQKALQQRNVLKSRLGALAAEVRELRAAKAQLGEEAKVAREARAMAEADVARASRVLREREAEARARRELTARRSASTPAALSTLLPEEGHLARGDGSHPAGGRRSVPSCEDAGGTTTDGPASSSDSGTGGGQREHHGGRTAGAGFSSSSSEGADRGPGRSSARSSSRSRPIRGWLVAAELGCAALSGMLALGIQWSSSGQGRMVVWGLLVVAILSPALMMAVLRPAPSRALAVLCLSWAALGFFASLAWPILVPPVPSAVEAHVQTAVQALSNHMIDSTALAGSHEECKDDFRSATA